MKLVFDPVPPDKKNAMRNFISSFLKLILYTPDGKCPGCGKILFFTEDFLCHACRKDLKPAVQPACALCGSALFTNEGRLCPSCLRDERAKALSGGFVLYELNRIGKKIAKSLHSGKSPDTLFYFGEELGLSFAQGKPIDPEVCIYVPEKEKTLFDGFLNGARCQNNHFASLDEVKNKVVLMLALQEERENLYSKACAFLHKGAKKVYCASVFPPR